jgi:hypothetical protein
MQCAKNVNKLMSVSRSGRSFYRRFLPSSKRRRRKSRKTDTRGTEDDSLVDAPAREDREREKHRDRRKYRENDTIVDEKVSIVKENGRPRDRRKYREEDEESLVDSVDRNEGEKIVRQRAVRERNGGANGEGYRVREKRREYYDRNAGD